MSKLVLLLALVMAENSVAAEFVHSDKCFDNGWNKKKYTQLKNNQFDANQETIVQLTKQLRYCLAVTDPTVRDGIAYEAYFSWLRGGKITGASLNSLFEQLSTELEVAKPDSDGVYLPFVALVYAEIVRVDRVESYLTDEERGRAVNTVAKYIDGISDYRGFDKEVGYRHAIAHSADIVLQLALNKSIDKSHIIVLAEAVAGQINPSSGHFYRYGEPERIARDIAYSMMRDDVELEFWQTWLQEVASPEPFANWREVFKSDEGLAKRNNTRQFLSNLYAMISTSEHTRLVELSPIVRELITTTG